MALDDLEVSLAKALKSNLLLRTAEMLLGFCKWWDKFPFQGTRDEARSMEKRIAVGIANAFQSLSTLVFPFALEAKDGVLTSKEELLVGRDVMEGVIKKINERMGFKYSPFTIHEDQKRDESIEGAEVKIPKLTLVLNPRFDDWKRLFEAARKTIKIQKIPYVDEWEALASAKRDLQESVEELRGSLEQLGSVGKETPQKPSATVEGGESEPLATKAKKKKEKS